MFAFALISTRWLLYTTFYEQVFFSGGAWIACTGVYGGWERVSYTPMFDCLQIFVFGYSARLYTIIGQRSALHSGHWPAHQSVQIVRLSALVYCNEDRN